MWSERYNTRDVHVFDEDERVQNVYVHVHVAFVTANRRVRRFEFTIATYTMKSRVIKCKNAGVCGGLCVCVVDS